MTARELHWRWNSSDIHVSIEQAGNGGALHFQNELIPFQILDRSGPSAHIEINGKTHRVYVLSESNGFTVWCDGTTYRLERIEKVRPGTASGGETGEIRAPMPGKVLRLNVTINSTVTENDTVAILESMKMESPIKAAKAGRVMRVLVQPGDVVELGELLVVIE